MSRVSSTGEKPHSFGSHRRRTVGFGAGGPYLSRERRFGGGDVGEAEPKGVKGIVKPTPAELMEDTGSGLDYGTRPDRMLGMITPNDRFFVRSHAPTPRIDADTWELRIEG